MTSSDESLKAVLFVSGDQHKNLYGESFVPAWYIKPVPKDANLDLMVDALRFRKPESWKQQDGKVNQ